MNNEAINLDIMRVLIVEDDKVLTLLMKTMVQRLSFNVVDCVTTGEDAITAAKSSKPDVILMDILLASQMDGIEAAIQIQKENKDIPVIFITGNSNEYYKKKALDTNYIDYLIKPVSFDELRNSLNKVNDFNL